MSVNFHPSHGDKIEVDQGGVLFGEIKDPFDQCLVVINL